MRTIERREIRGVLLDYTPADSTERLKAKRQEIWEAGGRIIAQTERENRDMTSVEVEDFDALMRHIDLIDRFLESRNSNRAYVVDPGKVGGDQMQGTEIRTTSSYDKAFRSVMFAARGSLVNPDDIRELNAHEYRALATGTGAAGGYLVPTEFERRLVEKLHELNVMRRLATVIQTASDREIPILTDDGVASWTAEAQPIPEDDLAFDQKTLKGYKATRLIKVSDELFQDSAIPVEDIVINAFARSIAALEEQAFVAGDGSGKPTGVLQGASQGKVATTGQTTSITPDDLTDLYFSLAPQYRGRAAWLMHDSTLMAISKLKNGQQEYLLKVLDNGAPPQLFGRPVYTSPYMPQMAASAKSILFGDFSYYWIADRHGRVIKRLDQPFATTGQIGFLMFERVDGVLTMPEAVKYFQNSAS